MAVIKSILLGTARKSISDVNFYKTKGVQIARSKPSIAPSYIPSQAQELQRYKMGFAQYVMNVADWRSFAWMLNLNNARKKKASNPANRMVSKILHEDGSYITDTSINYFEALKQHGEKLIKIASSGGYSLQPFTVWVNEHEEGDLSVNHVLIEDESGSIDTFAGIGDNSTTEDLRKLVVCGFMTVDIDIESGEVIVPATVYAAPCVKRIVTQWMTGPLTSYYFPLTAGILAASGIQSYVDLKKHACKTIVLYLARVGSPQGGNVITDGTPLNYSNFLAGTV